MQIALATVDYYTRLDQQLGKRYKDDLRFHNPHRRQAALRRGGGLQGLREEDPQAD
jgi:hypothetical protein